VPLVHATGEKWVLYNTDCLRAGSIMGPESVDAVITDPPAGIAFMGKAWDDPDKFPRGNRGVCRKTGKGNPCDSPGFAKDVHWEYTPKAREGFIAFLSERMRVALDLLKPGHYGLVWALPRTSHWTATALEDAGFEIRDRISHLFGTGFPKGQGCLKPACEDWWLVRKPGKGVRPLGIDACRIRTVGPTVRPPLSTNKHEGYQRPRNGDATARAACEARRGESHEKRDALGRWPANLVLSHHPECVPVGTKRVKGSNPPGPNPMGKAMQGGSKNVPPAQDYTDADGMETVETWTCHEDCPVRLLDEQSGEASYNSAGAFGIDHNDTGSIYGGGEGIPRNSRAVFGYGDRGGPSRFFYCPKSSRRDRGEGNTHPTCKNTALMRWLIKLISAEGDTVLDPFAGSGSTGVACAAECREFVGFEDDTEHGYYDTAVRRVQEAYR
jgi:DNA modification methylase